ncbi:MAG: hypothetical protein WA152_02420 [Microgenomates group bacterium]
MEVSRLEGDWKFGEKVEQSNIAGFIINSFSISEGKSYVQFLYVYLCSIKSSEDIFGKLHDFVENNGYDKLSQASKEKILSIFLSNPAHAKKAEKFIANPKESLNKQIRALCDLKQLNSEEDLIIDLGCSSILEVEKMNLKEFIVAMDRFKNEY